MIVCLHLHLCVCQKGSEQMHQSIFIFSGKVTTLTKTPSPYLMVTHVTAHRKVSPSGLHTHMLVTFHT